MCQSQNDVHPKRFIPKKRRCLTSELGEGGTTQEEQRKDGSDQSREVCWFLFLSKSRFGMMGQRVVLGDICVFFSGMFSIQLIV